VSRWPNGVYTVVHRSIQCSYQHLPCVPLEIPLIRKYPVESFYRADLRHSHRERSDRLSRLLFRLCLLYCTEHTQGQDRRYHSETVSDAIYSQISSPVDIPATEFCQRRSANVSLPLVTPGNHSTFQSTFTVATADQCPVSMLD